jgi:hypothetical protein
LDKYLENIRVIAITTEERIMAITTPNTTIVSAEDPAVSRLVVSELSATQNGVFSTTYGNNAVVDVGAGSGAVTSGAGTTNITFATGGNQSVVLASLTTSEINTAVLSQAAVYNTDKEIFITGIDQSVTQQYILGNGGTDYILPIASQTVLGGVKVGDGLSISDDGTLSADGGGGSGSVTSVGLSMPAGFSVANSPVTGSGVLLVTTSLNGIVKGNGSGLVIASTATDYQVPITLTTTGTSGAATFNGTTLNIPQYSGGGGSGVSSISATSPVIVNTSTGAVTVSFTSTLLASQGGTSFSTYATGDLIYASATNTLAKRAAGATGTVLTMVSGVPTWQAPSGGGGGLSTVSAGTGTSVVQSGNTATVSVTTATTSVVGGIKVGGGLSITADGTLNATGGGGGSSPEVVIFRYNANNQFSGTGYGVISQTSGVTATVTNAATNIVRLVFNGRTTPPKSFIVYGQNGAPTGTTWRVTPVAVLSTFTATGIVISGSPPDPLSIMDSINNTFQITLTTTVSNISGTEAYAIMVIGF